MVKSTQIKYFIFILILVLGLNAAKADTLSSYSGNIPNQSASGGLWQEIAALMQSAKSENPLDKADNYKKIANAYFQMKDFDKSLFYAVKALENYKLITHTDQSPLIEIEILIARLHLRLKNLKMGIPESKEILQKYQGEEFLPYFLPLYFELGNVYFDNFQARDTAQLYFLKAHSLLNKYPYLINPYLQAEMQLKRNSPELAKPLFYKALDLAKEKQQFVEEYNASLGLSNCYMLAGQPDSAMLWADNAFRIAAHYNYPYLKLDAYKMFADLFNQTGNFELAYQYSEKYRVLSDSVEMEQIQETSERLFNELKLAESRQNSEELASRNSFQLTIILILSISFFILMLLGLYMMSLVKKNKRLRSEMEIFAEELQVKSELLATRAQELERLNKEINAIHQAYKNQIQGKEQVDIKLKEKSKAIMESLLYAKNIQDALFPPENLMTKSFSDFFVLWKPREVVSGDFYWFKQFDEYLYLALGDCTGHGVPGAFMSMLGISYLNEIISKYPDIEAGKMLDLLNDKILESLNQTGSQKVLRDGMDISLIKINKQTGETGFAAAYNNGYLVTKNPEGLVELLDLKADRRPIGLYGKSNEEFNEIRFQLTKGTKFYMSSDGYTDQFGGESHKKFMKKRLREYFIQIYDYPMYYQKIFLSEKFSSWRGNNEQLDDVLIIGFEL